MRYFEIAIEGPVYEVKGFCRGVRAACHKDAILVFSADEGIERYGLADLIKMLVHADSIISHVICAEDLKDKLVSAIEFDKEYRVREVVEIESASFGFSFEAYARRYANRIRMIISKQKGATVELLELTEEEKPEAKGIEAYAPEHDYEFKGSGKVYGRFEDVYKAFCEFKAEPLISVSKMELKLKD